MSMLRVGVLFGGRSGEHEVSLLSAASVINAIDKSKYEVVPIGITKEGHWLTAEKAERLLGAKPHTDERTEERHLRAGDPTATPGAALLAKGEEVLVPPVPSAESLVPFSTAQATPASKSVPHSIHVDVIFPVLHGTFGEDGTIQGLLELADIPYVGAGVLGSAAGMDKDVMKKLFAAADLPIVKHVTILRSQWERDEKATRKRIEKTLKYPVFVKPANLGSSVGISKAHDKKELGPAVAEAAKYDRKIVIEQGVGTKKAKAREIEVSVLGNDAPQASIAGEIVPAAEFYDYNAKYIDEGSKLLIPAKLSKSKMKQIQQLAIDAFVAVDCSGLARVDFLMDPKSGKLYVNEINTMPGFTAISMYPKLWGASGLEYTSLISRLIDLALERHADKKRNRYTKE
jgi:D-alanine-D-alanine ligase